jgi:hypothetical protein
LRSHQSLSYLRIPPKFLEPEVLLPLRVFENMVLRRIFVPKRDEVTGDGRKLHN